MKKNRTSTITPALVAALCFASAMIGSAQTDGAQRSTKSQTAPRMALFTAQGDRALSDLATTQIETVLSKESAWELLERQQIDRILKEHELTANGVAAARNHQLGTILGADLMVFLENRPGLKGQIVQVSIVESRTGLILGNLEEPEATLTAAPDLVVTAVKSVLAKASVPLSERHYVGILGFRSEEIG